MVEELKKDKNYLEAKSNQSEGYNRMTTSCISCKFKPNYMEAIPFLRIAADKFFGFSKTKPIIYRDSLALEEAKCREKLIICLQKVGSLKDAGDQGVKLAKIYVAFLSDFDAGYKTMENFNMDFVQSNSLNNNTIQRSLKGILEIAKDFYCANALKHAEKAYTLLYETAYSVFPGQAKSSEPYEYIYEGFYAYFEYLVSIKEHEKCMSEILKTLELISPSKEQLLMREEVLGKEANLDVILTHYYKLMLVCIFLEDTEKLDQNYRMAQEISQDSTQQMILDRIRDIYNNCLNSDEKKFVDNLKLLNIILNPTEVKELRGVLRRYKRVDFPSEDNANNSNTIDINKNNLNNANANKNNFFNSNNNNNSIPYNILNQNIELKKEKIDTNFGMTSSSINTPQIIRKGEENLNAIKNSNNLAKDLGNMLGNQNQNFQNLNKLNDMTDNFRKIASNSSEGFLINNKNIKDFQQEITNQRIKKYEVQDEDDEEEDENIKDFVVILDEDKKKLAKEAKVDADDYL